MSAIIDGDAPMDGNGVEHEPIKVLFVLHQGMDAMDFVGPLEVLSHAKHDIKNKGMFRTYKSLPIEAFPTRQISLRQQYVCR